MQQILDDFREARGGAVVTAGLYVERAMNLGYTMKYPVYNAARNDIIQSDLVSTTAAPDATFTPSTKMTWTEPSDPLDARNIVNLLLNVTLKDVTPQGPVRLNLKGQPLWARYVKDLSPVVGAQVVASWDENFNKYSPAITVRE